MKTNKLILCGVLAGLITSTARTGYAQSQPSANSAITWTAGVGTPGRSHSQEEAASPQNESISPRRNHHFIANYS